MRTLVVWQNLVYKALYNVSPSKQLPSVCVCTSMHGSGSACLSAVFPNALMHFNNHLGSRHAALFQIRGIARLTN